MSIHQEYHHNVTQYDSHHIIPYRNSHTQQQYITSPLYLSSLLRTILTRFPGLGIAAMVLRGSYCASASYTMMFPSRPGSDQTQRRGQIDIEKSRDDKKMRQEVREGEGRGVEAGRGQVELKMSEGVK